MTSAVRGALYGLLAAGSWGGLYVVSDVVLQTIPPFTLLTVRLLLGAAALGLLILGVTRGKPASPPGVEILRLVGVGVVGFGISVGAQFVGTDLSNAINGSLITSASPAFILLFAPLILRERLTLLRAFAVGLATAGVLIIVDPARADFGSATFVGNLALALAALTWGLYSVLVRLVSRHSDTLYVSLYAMLGGLLVTIPAMVWELQTRTVGALTPETLLGVLYLSVIAMAAATWWWNRAFALLEAAAASLFFFVQPLVATLLATALLQQALTEPVLLGGVCIAAGVLLAMAAPARAAGREEK